MESDNILVVCTNSAGDRKLYSIFRNAEGQVWDRKHEKFVAFEDENFLNYSIPLEYGGGDLYLVEVPKRANEATCVIVYCQEGREPDIYDKIYYVAGAEIPEEIPMKIRPMAPMIQHDKHVSRTRSKVVQDHYSDTP